MNFLLQNILLGVSLAAPIGPLNIEIIHRTLKQGIKAGILLSLGATAADVTYLLLVFFGITAFIDQPMVKTFIWLFGAIVLFYLGYQSAKEFWQKEKLKRVPKKQRNSFLVGYAIAISNPIGIAWWLGVFGSVLATLPPGTPKLLALLYSSTLFIGVTAWEFGLALLVHRGKHYLNETVMRFISLGAGLVLIGFGVYFGGKGITALF